MAVGKEAHSQDTAPGELMVLKTFNSIVIPRTTSVRDFVVRGIRGNIYSWIYS